MKVRVYAQAYNDQDVIDISDEDYKKLMEMDINEKEEWLSNNTSFDVLRCNNLNNIELLKIKNDEEH